MNITNNNKQSLEDTMARATNAEVIRAFLDGRNAYGLSMTSTHYPQLGTVPPKGFLRSYGQLIARYDEGCGFLVFDFTASGEFISSTTSKHVGMIKRQLPSKCVMHPVQARHGQLLGGQ